MSNAAATAASTSQIVAAQNSHSHNKSNSSTVANFSHVHENIERNFKNYQSRQRMHRSSQYDRRADRSRSTSSSKLHSGNSSSVHENNSQQQIIHIGAGSFGSDEARYNLATRIMSNGVEVIVAGDKSTLPGGHPNQQLRILSTGDTFKMPMTLAPSTLKDHMLLMLPQTTSTINNKNDIGSDDDGSAIHVSNDIQAFSIDFLIPYSILN